MCIVKFREIAKIVEVRVKWFSVNFCVYKLRESCKVLCVRFICDMCLTIRAVIIAKEGDRSRGTKVNGNYSEEDEAGHAGKYLRPRASLTSGAFAALLPTELDASGVEVQKRKENQDSKKMGTEVLGGFENAQQARLSLPRLKLGGINSQTGLSNDGGGRIGRENCHDATTADFEVEKREVFISDILIRAQSSQAALVVAKNGKSKGDDRFTHGLSNPQAHRYNASAHLGVNLENEVRKLRPLKCS